MEREDSSGRRNAGRISPIRNATRSFRLRSRTTRGSSLRSTKTRSVVSWNGDARYFDVFSATPALAIERGTPFGVRWRVVTDHVGSRREPRCYVRRCQQIRIWPHRGRARQREMKFDRSAPHTRAPLSSRSSSSPFFFHSRWLPSTFRVPTNAVSSISPALSLQNGVSRTSRVPHGHPTPPPALANALPLPPSPPVPFWLARGAVHPILYNSLLSATSLPPVTLPRGAVQAGLLSSKPTPFYKYITRPSALAIPCPLSFLFLFRFSPLRRSFVRAVSR